MTPLPAFSYQSSRSNLRLVKAQAAVRNVIRLGSNRPERAMEATAAARSVGTSMFQTWSTAARGQLMHSGVGTSYRGMAFLANANANSLAAYATSASPKRLKRPDLM